MGALENDFEGSAKVLGHTLNTMGDDALPLDYEQIYIRICLPRL